MDNVIQVRVESKYGTERIMPVNEKGQVFAEMLRQATLTRGDIKYIKALGFEIEVVVEPVVL